MKLKRFPNGLQPRGQTSWGHGLHICISAITGLQAKPDSGVNRRVGYSQWRQGGWGNSPPSLLPPLPEYCPFPGTPFINLLRPLPCDRDPSSMLMTPKFLSPFLPSPLNYSLTQSQQHMGQLFFSEVKTNMEIEKDTKSQNPLLTPLPLWL